MEKDMETMEGLLHCLDDSITAKNRRYRTLEAQYVIGAGNTITGGSGANSAGGASGSKTGRVLRKEYSEYSARKKSIDEKFKKEVIDYQEKIDRMCRLIRKRQPSLMELSSEYINTKGRFPRYIMLGKLHVTYNNLDFFVPKSFSFPFERPMFICDESKNVLLHKVLLRLLFALPIDKQEYYVFDPRGLGKTVSKFNALFSNERLFPQKKILSSMLELKEVLKNIMAYILDLQSNVFDIKTNCQDWDSYNRWLYSRSELRRVLPYKVFIFTDVPDEMDQECFDMFRTLIVHGKQCGLLVLFSFNKAILDTQDAKMRKMETELKSCIENSEQLHAVFEQENIGNDFESLTVKNVGEKFPDDFKLANLLEDLSDYTEKYYSSQSLSFDEIMKHGTLFNCNSKNGLSIPVGCGVSGNSIIELKIGDDASHYIVGGTTGSGKSNFLHNLIMSACCRYSPKELRVYLLDFKEGVEFSQYANPNLKHANLVATEANTEYGITILRHLIKEQERRYRTFKLSRCNNIQGYRDKNPNDEMPRIMVIIDEFQVLFENEQKDQTIETLTTLAKQGRGCGIHLVLATQTLKGIDLGALTSQFGGRVALKCSVEDSKYLLGGNNTNNIEAAELNVPFAILNTSQGTVSGNIKFMVSKAEETRIAEWIRLIERECRNIHIETTTKIFEGQSLPKRPAVNISGNKPGLEFVFGEFMDYDAEPFSVSFRPRDRENLLICGHDDLIKKSLIDSVILSALDSEYLYDIIYVGDDSDIIDKTLVCKIECLCSMADFCVKYGENPFNKKRILIIDNCDLVAQIGYTTYAPKENAKIFADYLNGANKKGSHIIEFCEGSNKIKNGVPKDQFNYIIGYAINADERNNLMGASSYSSKSVKNDRAFLAVNLELKAWFRPYSV